MRAAINFDWFLAHPQLVETTFAIMTRREYEKKSTSESTVFGAVELTNRKVPPKHWGIRNGVNSKYLSISIQY